MREDDEEMSAMRACFRALVVEWDLGRTEAAGLLGVAGDELGLDLVPVSMDADAERRMRLLVEVRGLLPIILPDVAHVPRWLREGFRGVDNDGNPLATPMDFLSGPVSNIRKIRDALRARAWAS